MSVLLECERCGAQEKTASVMLAAGLVGPGIPTYRPEIPDGWTRPTLPREDGSLWKTDLCAECKADLFRFMAGGLVVDDAEAASRAMGILGDPGDPCAPGGSCPCPAGEADCARMEATRGD